jgi:predicted lipid-binding transport protein (Tim44 family)
MNMYDFLALGLFAAVGIALWRTFRPEGEEARAGTADRGALQDIIGTMKRKAIPREEAPKDEAKDDITELADRLSRLDRHFEPQAFMEQAKELFTQVLKAFEGGQKGPLKNLCAPAVAKSFGAEMDAMAARGRKTETEILRFKHIFIRAIDIGKRRAAVTVEFQTEQTALIKDKAGKVVEGDDNQIELVKDIWKFSKEFSRRGAWILEETRADEGKINEKSP